jgi:hypothetical protein
MYKGTSTKDGLLGLLICEKGLAPDEDRKSRQCGSARRGLQPPSLFCTCFAWQLGWKTELAEQKKGRIKTKKVFSPVDDVQSLLFHTIFLARL